jgi:putative methyltransferase (TIGR04325 family)
MKKVDSNGSDDALAAAMPHHYCCYFDHNYLPRALLMIESLRAQKAAFHLHVLCLSELCAELLGALALPEVTIIALADLERRYPELQAVKHGDRTPIEYIFTLTPFMPAYCLEVRGLSEITYLDSDLFFYRDPQLVFDHIGDASIAIIPHRFAPEHLDDRQHGEFNVGWITFRATPEGLRCLADYQRDCLAWCYDRVEDGKYADQGYLDAWPTRYRDLAIVSLKGANTAVYNADNYRIAERDGGFWCDDEPLIFYHFHAVFPDLAGSYFARFPVGHFRANSTVMRRLYRPYLARLVEQTHATRERFPALAGAARLTRPGLKLFKPPLSGWTDDLVSQVRVVHALRFRAQVRETGELAGGADRLAWFADVLQRAADASGRVSVLDWGGGYGLYAAAARRLFPGLILDWHVVEVSTVHDYGRAMFPDVVYYDGDASALARRYDVVIAVAALHYAADWRATVADLAAAATKFLVLTDLPVAAGADAVTLTEHPMADIPELLCLGAILDEAALGAALGAAGLGLERDLMPWRGPPIALGAIQLSYRSLLFSRAIL